MPLNTAMVGQSTRAFTHDIDARWIMAYSAGLNDLNPRYLDTQAARVCAHPVFPVCLEWPVILASRELPGYQSQTPAEGARGVHASHDLHLYRPIEAGDRLTTQATILGLTEIKPGAAQLIRLDTTDEAGELVCRTYQLGISRGVAVEGEPIQAEDPPGLPVSAGTGRKAAFEIDIPAAAAHVYTECARIWNPIHTDRAVALVAGLPDIILHGTATMALAVSRLVDEYLGGDATRVRRLGGRFAAMVLMPSTVTLVVESAEEQAIFFDVCTADGQRAFKNAYLCFE
ncbi:MAG: MaoC family dehydratase N-terminal domain-containing protein [Pseudomonadales bacterium]